VHVNDVDRMPIKSVCEHKAKLTACFQLCLLVKISRRNLNWKQEAMTPGPCSRKHQRAMALLHQTPIEREQDLLGAAGRGLRYGRKRISDVQDR
jgi:hypothetical protein